MNGFKKQTCSKLKPENINKSTPRFVIFSNQRSMKLLTVQLVQEDDKVFINKKSQYFTLIFDKMIILLFSLMKINSIIED